MNQPAYHLAVILLFFSFAVSAQEGPPSDTPVVSSSYITNVSSSAGKLQHKLDKQSSKALHQWQRQEAKIKRKLAKIDSLKAEQLFGNADKSFQQLEQRLQSSTSLSHYIPSLDTLGTSLKFLQQNPKLLSNLQAQEKLKDALSKVKGLENGFGQSEQIKKFLQQRKQYLKEQLGKIGFAKEMKKLNQRAYYYSAQVSQYEELLKDRKKATQKALSLLSQTKIFKNFMRKHSQLASLFRLPGNSGDPSSMASLTGLQTRAQINGLIQQQLAAGGPGARQQFRQNMEQAQGRMNELKNKLMKLGTGSSNATMPEGFKPNNQKTKTFLQRLELGTNLQSQKSNGYFPTTTDVGLSVGYRINDRSTAGIGASYRFGLGKDIRHIKLTHQGVGLRSFVDWKIKGNFWLTGGYEMNYRTEFRRIEQLKSLNAWQQSGLIGLSKIVSLKARFFKKTKLQLLWDFMSYRQVPKGQPVVFRIGYNF